MRDYGKIQTVFWTSGDVQGLSDSSKLLAIYLLSSPHTNQIGCFRLPDGYVSDDLGWSIETLSKGFRDLQAKGFATRDEATKWVVIHKFLKWNEIENPNQAKAAVKLFDQIPDSSAVKPMLARALAEFAPRFPADIRAPFETLPKPFRNQEQEQEQEQEQKQDTSGSAPGAVAPPHLELEGGSAQRRPDPRPVEVVFDHWQSVMGSPRSKLDAKREKVIKSALKAGYSVEDLCKAIDGCALSPFHMGLNDQRTKFNGIDLILRNADQIDKFVALADAPPPAGPAPGSGKVVTAADWADSTESVMAMAKRHGLEQQNGEHYIWFRLRVIKAHGDEALMERELSAASRRNEGEYERMFKLFFGVAPKLLPSGGYEKRPQRPSF